MRKEGGKWDSWVCRLCVRHMLVVFWLLQSLHAASVIDMPHAISCESSIDGRGWNNIFFFCISDKQIEITRSSRDLWCIPKIC